MALKAKYLLKRNIDALLKARGQSQKDLSIWCGATEGWLSQILNKETRGMRMQYLDKIAGFFGLEPHQLFLPGISALTERRVGGDRRTGVERRGQRAAEMLVPAPSLAELQTKLAQLDQEEYRKISRRLMAALNVGELPPESATPREPQDLIAPRQKLIKRTRGGRT